jgi:hypothetical protein
MFSWNLRKTLFVTILAAVGCCLAGEVRSASASSDTSAKVIFTASGTFAASPVSGEDQLKLSGQPFTITVVGLSSLRPSQHDRNWALFQPLQMTGTVYSELIPGQAVSINSTTAAIDQAVGASEDIFQSGFPVTVVGIALTVRSHISLPGGTLSTALLRPFSSVALDSTNSTVTYSNSTNSTVLAVQNGTLVATLRAE